MRWLIIAFLMAGCVSNEPGPPDGGEVNFADYCGDISKLRQVIDDTLKCGVCITINCGDAGFVSHCTPGSPITGCPDTDAGACSPSSHWRVPR